MASTKDWYKILQVSRTATTHEIKSAYRKLALKFHPDKHGGDAGKTQTFKEITEAYGVLVDNDRRRQYDASTTMWGATPNGWYNRNRKSAPPPNYRKVYAPHAPPNGKWHDAHKHYEMHYGDGMMKESLRQAHARASAAGEFEYTSPLGKGFSFQFDPSASRSTYSQNSYQKNPYSKAPQGPPTVQFHYEEGYISEAKDVLRKKRRVVTDLHSRREERQQREHASKMAEAFGMSQGANGRQYQAFNSRKATSSVDSGCSIM